MIEVKKKYKVDTLLMENTFSGYLGKTPELSIL